MKVTLDQNTIQSISLFQNLTGSSVVDAISEGDEIYFVIAQGQYGSTVGKNGSKIKNAERVFKKSIKVFEYSEGLEEFIKNIIPGVQEFSVKEKTVFVKIKPNDKAKVIGKGGKNIKIINKFLQRLFDMEELKVK
ncbi:MAG: NusA-like transcription termination signal-binding factor [Candidatus Aenigmarchaeota archaeon]|nr:NusA-like transcription termination signal-binding factor [Candidatus Aenigmarchaeota archaeon]